MGRMSTWTGLLLSSGQRSLLIGLQPQEVVLAAAAARSCPARAVWKRAKQAKHTLPFGVRYSVARTSGRHNRRRISRRSARA
jgi:hypothetical protein